MNSASEKHGTPLSTSGEWWSTRKRRKEMTNIQILVGNISHLLKDINLHIQETQKLHRINSMAHSKSAEGQRQGQNLKAAREK